MNPVHYPVVRLLSYLILSMISDTYVLLPIDTRKKGYDYIRLTIPDQSKSLARTQLYVLRARSVIIDK